ncbi:MAG: site-specific DNA-methyltransferase [Candidatus Omnitrophica bacterium]|nr:site-specific DNA-methyltransferase [Candidatus Omnitrophota bacterium]
MDEGIKVMERYLNKVTHGHCFDVMADLPNKSVDMILCDPPYGVTSGRDTWDKILPVEELWMHYKRIIKDDGAIVLTATNPFASLLVSSNVEMFKYDWVWSKERGGNILTVNHQPFRSHELALVFSKGAITETPNGHYMKYNPQMVYGKPYRRITSGKAPSTVSNSKNWSLKSTCEDTSQRHPLSVLNFNRETGSHPTQKPVPLFEYLIRTFTNPNDIVLDNCAGSGTTALAAIRSERRFILIEQAEEWCNESVRRIAAEPPMLLMLAGIDTDNLLTDRR